MMIMGMLLATVAQAEPVPTLAPRQLENGVSGREILPMFDFKDIVAGQAVDFSTLKMCTQLGPTIRCSPLNRVVAGVEASGLRFGFYNSRLSTMEFYVHNSLAPTLLVAFTQKYGEPCEIENPIWQNKLGAKFDNKVITWCFASGNLKLSFLGSRNDEATVTYVDINKAPAAPVPIDF